MNDTEFFAATDVGCVRDHNEDFIACEPDIGLWVVADGMGGHASGEVASEQSCHAIINSVKNGKSLIDAIEVAHGAVKDAVAKGLGGAGMGSTVVAAQVEQGYYQIAWVGDSRAYAWDGADSLKQLTKDHSFVQKLIDNDAITAEQASSHPMRNVITQSLGAEQLEKVTVDTCNGQLPKGHLLLLCSDGLTGELSDEDIITILQQQPSLEQKTGELIQRAKGNGGNDNISVILISSSANVSMSTTQPVDTDAINDKLAEKKESFFKRLFKGRGE